MKKFIGYFLLFALIVGPIFALYFLVDFEAAFVYTFIIIIVPLVLFVACILVSIIFYLIED